MMVHNNCKSHTYIKKIIAFIAAAVFVSALSFGSFVPAHKTFAAVAEATPEPPANTVIHQKSVKQTIVSGLTHESITRFTEDGWLNINVMKADLQSPYIKVDTMSNTTSIQQLTSMYDLATEKKAVAAINGGFYIWGSSNNINPIGPFVVSGDIKTAYDEFNTGSDKMATFSMNTANQPLISYWDTQVTLVVNGTVRLAAGRYNRPYYGYTDFSVTDRKWSKFSVGASPGAPDITEAVVSAGKVIEVRYAMPPVEIPTDGFVITTRREGVAPLLQSIKAGDSVSLEIKAQPDWTKLKMAVTGGAVLVKDGAALKEFTHVISGRHPRSAIGSSKDGRYMYMVTVDGRQQRSIGMTQDELAALMVELGAYNAVNLDGGGSTAMLARDTGDMSVSVANLPSDGSVRKVSTAVGVIAQTPSSVLTSLLVMTDDNEENIFVNTSRKFIVKGLDAYGNPVQIKPETVQWSVTGVTGSFKDCVFYPKSFGEAKVTARYGAVTATIPVSVLSSPVQLVLSEKTFTLPIGSKNQLQVKGINRNGYFANIDPADLNWGLKNIDGSALSAENTGKGSVGSISKGLFTALKPGTTLIDASIGTTHAYCAVSAVSYNSIFKDGFEIGNGSFTAYPDTVKGSYVITTELKYRHSGSGKLEYDMSEGLDKTRAAYLVFSNDGVDLNSNTAGIGLWVYTDYTTTSWLRAEVYDQAGGKHLVDISKGMDWTGWKYVEANLEDIDSPTLLTRLYIVQVDPIADKGVVYFDDLYVIETGSSNIDTTKVPSDTIPADPANVLVKAGPGTTFRFGVFGESREPAADDEVKITTKFTDTVNKWIDVGAIVGFSEHNIADQIKKPLMKTWTVYGASIPDDQAAYKSYDIKNSRLIQLDIGSGSIRTSCRGQWSWFLERLNTFKGTNLFIFLPTGADSFSDRYEADLFQDILTEYRQKTGRNIWVISKSDTNSSYIYRGIKFLTTAGLDIIPQTDAQKIKYLLVTIEGNKVTYQFKNLN